MIVLPKLTAGDFQGKGECPTFFTAQIFAETSMRTRMLAAVSLILAACAGSEAPPALSITPSGAQTVSGPVTVTASPASLTNDLTWSLSGPGTISGTKGIALAHDRRADRKCRRHLRPVQHPAHLLRQPERLLRGAGLHPGAGQALRDGPVP